MNPSIPHAWPAVHTRRDLLLTAAALAGSGYTLAACANSEGPPNQRPGLLRARIAISDPQGQSWTDTRRSANRLRLVALHAPFAQAEKAAELKAANPDCLTFAYQDWGFTGYEGQRATGLYRPECEANRWMALDGAGNLMENLGFPGSWLVDCGRPGYAERWASAVADRMEDNGGRSTWDGILIDDINAFVTLTEPHWPAGYSSHIEHYERAVRPGIKIAAAFLSDRGYQLWGNLGGWGDFPIQDGLIPDLDICMEEFFGAAAGQTPHPAERIANSARSAERCAAAGKVYLGVAQLVDDGDEATATYADLLMRIVGRPGRAALAAHKSYGSEPWFSGFGIDLGRPRESKRVSGALYSRRFARGTAYANTGGEPVALPDGSQLKPVRGRVIA